VHTVCPVALAYLPLGHSAHSSCPSSPWDVPTAHTVQFGSPDRALLPAWHAKHSVASSPEVDPAAHGVHCSCRTAGAKVPFWQGEHGSIPAAALNRPTEQKGRQSDALLEFTPAFPVPAGHGRHSTDDAFSAYVSLAHGAHA